VGREGLEYPATYTTAEIAEGRREPSNCRDARGPQARVDGARTPRTRAAHDAQAVLVRGVRAPSGWLRQPRVAWPLRWLCFLRGEEDDTASEALPSHVLSL
jgi:hypothetical protein